MQVRNWTYTFEGFTNPLPVCIPGKCHGKKADLEPMMEVGWGPRYKPILAASRGATSPLERISPNTARHSPHTSNPNIMDNTKANIKRKMFPHRSRHTNSDKLATMRIIHPRTLLVSSQIRISDRLHANHSSSTHAKRWGMCKRARERVSHLKTRKALDEGRGGTRIRSSREQ